jgi:hypothetical protein
MRTLHASVLACLLLGASLARPQSPESLHKTFADSLVSAKDSLIEEGRRYAATLLSHGDAYFHQSSWSLRGYADSLLTVHADSLDIPRRTSVRLLGLDMERAMHQLSIPAHATLVAILGRFEKEMKILVDHHAPCPACVSRDDFEGAFQTFRANADSITEIYGDSLATVVEDWETSIDDTSKSLAESIDDTVATLKDDYADYLKDHASRLELTTGYEGHASSRGRDNGVSEASFGPTVTYHHKTGLVVGVSAGWVGGGTSEPDVSELTGGYEFTLSPVLQGSASYTHFWYATGSLRPNAVTNQEVSGMLALTTDVLNLSGTLLDDFTAGDASEITVSLDLSKDIPLSDHAFGGALKFTPSASATWGQQTERLLQKRVIRAKKKNIVRISGTPYDVFSIMGYQVSFPLDLEIGSLTIMPTVQWIVPANVLNSKNVLVNDPSNVDPYVSAGLTLNVIVY